MSLRNQKKNMKKRLGVDYASEKGGQTILAQKYSTRGYERKKSGGEKK